MKPASQANHECDKQNVQLNFLQAKINNRKNNRKNMTQKLILFFTRFVFVL